LSQGGFVHWDGPPPHCLEALGGTGFFDDHARFVLTVAIDEQHRQARTVATAQQAVREGEKEAGAVSRELVGGQRSSMLHAAESFEAGVDDRTGGPSA
jgi:hypothetical protein